MIELTGISKRYPTVQALDSVNLVVPRERTTVLIGPSGCGKSTLLRIMIGLLQPTGGRVTVNGDDLTPGNLRGIRRRIGYVIQDGGLFPHMTARHNVTLPTRHQGWKADVVQDRLDELVRLVKFPESGLDRYPAQLSGGQRQRVGLMRALMLDPAILLLDEPLGALDPMIRYELQTDLRDIFATLNKTVVMVTHDLAEAVYFGHVLVLMRRGRIVQSGSFEDLRDHPADPFVGGFIRAQRTPLDLTDARTP